MSPEMLQLIAWSTLDTLVMVGLSGLFGTLLGLPLGIFLATSRANELFPAPAANRILGLIVNATRSTPFAPTCPRPLRPCWPRTSRRRFRAKRANTRGILEEE